MREMSGVIIVIMKIEKDLCIFCKGKKKNTEDRATNTDGNLVPVMVNKVISYRNLEKIRLSYGIDAQNLYFFIRKEPLPDTIIY
jgi:hypothetical protein